MTEPVSLSSQGLDPAQSILHDVRRAVVETRIAIRCMAGEPGDDKAYELARRWFSCDPDGSPACRTPNMLFVLSTALAHSQERGASPIDAGVPHGMTGDTTSVAPDPLIKATLPCPTLDHRNP